MINKMSVLHTSGMRTCSLPASKFIIGGCWIYEVKAVRTIRLIDLRLDDTSTVDSIHARPIHFFDDNARPIL